MRLIVDRPKPIYGNTNDGNTAHRFFLNPEKSGEITGLNVELGPDYYISTNGRWDTISDFPNFYISLSALCK